MRPQCSSGLVQVAERSVIVAGTLPGNVPCKDQNSSLCFVIEIKMTKEHEQEARHFASIPLRNAASRLAPALELSAIGKMLRAAGSRDSQLWNACT